jgi:hypothetical protein
MDEDCEVSVELYNALIAEYDICGNKHNCNVNIIYRKYIINFYTPLLSLQKYLVIIDSIP